MITVLCGSKSSATPLIALSTASTDGLKNFATCDLYVVVVATKLRNPWIVGVGVNGSRVPLQGELPPFHVTATVVVSWRTKLHELRSCIVGKIALQPSIEALRERIKVRFRIEFRTLEFSYKKM